MDTIGKRIATRLVEAGWIVVRTGFRSHEMEIAAVGRLIDNMLEMERQKPSVLVTNPESEGAD